MSALKAEQPLRFRCQVGHALAADVLAKEQESRIDEAMRVALRIVNERVQLVRRMAEEARRNGRSALRLTGEAERLAALLRDTLTQWELHRGLISERLAYLRAKLGEA